MRVLSSGVGVVGGVALTAIVAFGIDGRIVESSQSVREQKIEIVNDPQPFVFGASPRDLGRPFNSCSPAQPARTILEVIGHDAKRVLVHHYESAAWRDIGLVRDYIRRVLSAVTETGALTRNVVWSETARVEISTSIEFTNGQRRRLELANGYAHFEDLSGCEWWARYLGGDRTKWVVRP